MPVAFLIRFYTVVLIEPMLNPLKLPLSILFAKFVYPLLLVIGLVKEDPGSFPGFSSDLVNHLDDLIWHPMAWMIVIGTFYLLPDAVTFLFWEMRANWRLYRANRPTTIRPVEVGHHGESIKGLLHWGFHSGTVPRLYSRLRAAEREATRTDMWRAARTHRAALRGVEESVRRFVERDFIAMLDRLEMRWGGPRIRVVDVRLGTNRIRVELVPDNGDSSAWLEWEDRSGWLVAGWAESGFLTTLNAQQSRIFEVTLAFLYKRAGVDVVREQIRSELPAEAKEFDIGPAGLLVWYDNRDTPARLYDLGDPVDELHPKTAGQRQPLAGPVLNAKRLIFGRLQLTWQQWMDTWHHDGAIEEGAYHGPAQSDLRLLPPRLEVSMPFTEIASISHETERDLGTV